MEKSDFKKITGEHKAIVEKIIRLNGDCRFIKICDLCPFYKSNSTSDNQYSCPRCDFSLVPEIERNRKVLLAARKFLELFKDDLEVDKMNFGEALLKLKNGQKVAREGWNGKGMNIIFVSEREENGIKYNPFFQIKNVNGSVSTWVPSVNDCLATDWYEIIEDER